jgi:hypothetical protein
MNNLYFITVATKPHNVLDVLKQNIELNTKFSQTFNELQKYKRLSETQKITINNLQTEKADLQLNQKKHVTFMN